MIGFVIHYKEILEMSNISNNADRKMLFETRGGRGSGLLKGGIDIWNRIRKTGFYFSNFATKRMI